MSLSIPKPYLALLACPACRGEIEPLPGESGLECLGCGRIYPVRDGIPVMLVDEASPPKQETPGPGNERRGS